MPRIIVIADDFTGAAEIGGIAYHCGLSVSLVTSLSVQGIPDKDVIVLDTNTRSLDPASVPERILDALVNTDLGDFDLVYKKVDSVLRGPIETEIKTIMQLMKVDFAVLIPANPSKGRIIKNGRYYIDGLLISETDFAHDPEYPRLYNEVELLIRDATAVQPMHSFRTDNVQKQIVMPDIYAQEHLSQVIAKLKRVKFLPAGGADFFKALLIERFDLKMARDYPFPKLKGQILYVTGSLHAQASQTLAALKNLGYSSFYLPEMALDQDLYFHQWSDQILRSYQNGRNTIIARPENKISDAAGIKKITSLISEAVLQLILECDRMDNIIIEGGETASTIFRRLGNSILDIREVLADGVVKVKVRQLNISIIVKPGSYRWPQEFFSPVQ